MERYDVALMLNRIFGPYAWVFWGTILCNVVLIQLLWFPRLRAHHTVLFLISLGVLVGMWLERFMLIVSSLHRDFLPSSWGMFYPTLWDFAFLVGSLGLFFVLFLLFVRLLPVVSMFELRRLLQRRARALASAAPGPA